MTIIYLNGPYAGTRIPPMLLVPTKGGAQAVITDRISIQPGFVVADLEPRGQLFIPNDLVSCIYSGNIENVDERYQPL